METEFSSVGGISPSPDSFVDDLSVTASNLMQPRVDYFLPNMSENEWRSNYHFNQAGMQIVYTISNLTLNAIYPNYDQYLGYALNYEDLLNFTNVNVSSMVWDNKGPLGFLAGGVLFIVLLTLFGFGWCLAKCCCGDKGCCTSNKDSEDRLAKKLEQKRDKYKRASCGILFATLIIVFMFGLVCCFVTNEQMKTSIEQMPEDVDNSLADTDIYLSTTKLQITALFKDNYDLLRATLNHILEQSGEIIKNGLARKTGAQALNNLTDIVDTVESVRNTVLNVEKSSKSLEAKADRLQLGLNGSKDRLLKLLEKCQSEKCQELKNTPEIRSLRVQNDFQNLPDMTEILRELGSFLSTDVRRSIEKGKNAFNELGIRIKNEVEPVLPEIRKVINDTGKELEGISKALTDALDSIPVNQSREDMKEIELEMKKYAPYRYYGVLGVCATLAFIFTLLTLGIFVGFCGKQPGSEYSNECCSRKTGSSFINCGIFWMFLTGGVLMAVALVHFLGAGLLTQVVCEAVHHRDNRTEAAFRLPKLRIQSKYNYVVPAYSEIISDCKDGASAYHAFQLKPVYDIENIKTLADRFKDKAKNLANQVTLPNDATEGIVFLSPEAKQQLTRFSNSKITKIKFDKFADQLDDSILSVDLNEVIRRLNMTVDDQQENSDINNQIRNELEIEILILRSLQKEIVEPMVRDVKNSSQSLRSLSEQQKDLSRLIVGVADAAEKAQESLHNSGATRQVKELAKEFESEFVRHVEDYANFTYVGIRDSVGQCEPLYRSLNTTVTTFCHKIGSPLAGFWFALTCLLLLFFPLIIVGIVLARLYSKYKSVGYESETYYSAYGDGDTIPLSLSANVRRHKRGREPSHSAAARFPSRFEDTSQNSSVGIRVTSDAAVQGSSSRTPPFRSNLHFVDSSHEALIYSGSATTEIQIEQAPPPYSEVAHLASYTDTSLANTSSSSSLHEAWGSQLVFNNHHTPPASGEYERPPPYYYPGGISQS